MGLTICKRLVEMMGGTISVKSVSGKGSVFYVSIRNVAFSHEELPAVEDDFGHEAIRFERAKVLVVDDVESNSNLIGEILSKANLDVLTADNGNEALKIAEEHQPDVILMDLRMHAMDGVEATRRLRANSRTKTIPVIATTASTMPDHRSSVLEKGFDGYILKPFKIRLLFSELSKYLKKEKEDCNAPMVDAPDDLASLDCFSSKEAANLSEVVGIIESDIIHRWKDLQKRTSMKAVRIFARELEELGAKYAIAFLSKYGRDLLDYANNFDVKSMKIMIGDFPKIMNEIKSLQEKKP